MQNFKETLNNNIEVFLGFQSDKNLLDLET